MERKDLGKMFAAKYVELNCSIKAAAEACGITYEDGRNLRRNLDVAFEIDRLLTEAQKAAMVSRVFVCNTLMTIIDRDMEPQPVLYRGEVVKGVVTWGGDKAIRALQTLMDEGFVEPKRDDAYSDLNDEQRVTLLRGFLESQRTGGARPAAPARKKDADVRRVRGKDVRKTAS